MDLLLSSIDASYSKQTRQKLIRQLLNQASKKPCRVLFPSGFTQVKFQKLEENLIHFEKQGESSSIPLSSCLGFTIRLSSKSLKIDSEISKNSSKNRKLENWKSVGPDQSLEGDPSKWDQFEENFKKFGIVSTFDEELYTTKKVPEDQLSREQVIRAKNIEKELMNKETLDEGKEDEEEMFGAVLGSGRFCLDKEKSKEIDMKENFRQKVRIGEERIDKCERNFGDHFRVGDGDEREKVKKRGEEERGKKRVGESITDVYFEVFSKIPRDKEYAVW
jgi:hypothetical protein